MTRLFRLPVTAAPSRTRSVYGTALALILAAMPLAPAAFAQEATPAAPPAGTTATAQPPAGATPAAPPAGATPDAGAPAATTPAGAPAGTTGGTPVTATPVSDKPADAAADAPKENPYGLGALWKNGDVIARGVLLIMAIMSLGTWIIMVSKFIEQARLFHAAKAVSQTFWTQKTIQEGAKTLKADSPFRYIAETGIIAARHHEGSMRDSIDLQSWTAMSIQRSLETINTRLQGGLAFLGTVGSTSPFIGLFGTVWGIYHALTAIGIAGQASIDKVAGPVGESLIMTAIGLATAVPAVLGYNLLVRRNKGAMDRVRNFGSDLHSVLIGGYRHEAGVSEGVKDDSPTTTTTSERV